MKKVLVTGGTSYIGKHCIAQLLEKNYDVSTTIRDINKSSEIKSDIEKFLKKPIELKFFEADLLKDDGWDDVIKSCDAIIHVAGPFPVNYDGKEEDLTHPHENGTMRIFKYANKNDYQCGKVEQTCLNCWASLQSLIGMMAILLLGNAMPRRGCAMH